MNESSLYDKIERLEAFEDKCKITIENISIQHNPSQEDMKDRLYIYYELHSKIGNELAFKQIDVDVIIYLKNGDIFMKKSFWHRRNRFWGFEVNGDEFYFENPYRIADIGKIKIYPVCKN